MSQLGLIRTFVEVARTGSFTVAARNLHISRSSVSKQVSMLEREMGVQLLLRSTHHVAPTRAGALFLEGGAQLLQNYAALTEKIRAGARSLRGTLRVGVPPAFGAHYLAPAVAEFTAIHPQVNVSLLLDDGNLDLVRDGLDLSLRITPALKDASYVSRVLAQVPQCLVASPEYLAEHGEPRRLEDLRDHNCLVHSIKSPTDVWIFEAGDLTTGIPVRGTIRSNFGPALYTAALLGTGISMHPYYMVNEAIQQGRLRVILPDTPPVRLAIYAIFANRNISLLARNFLEFIAKRYANGVLRTPFETGE